MFDGVGGEPPVSALTLYTDAFVVRGTIRTRQRRVTRHPQPGRGRFLVLSDVTFDEFGTRGETHPGRVRPDQPGCGALRGRRHEARHAAGAADAEGRRAGADLDPAVPGHRADPPHAGARPARGAGGAHAAASSRSPTRRTGPTASARRARPPTRRRQPRAAQILAPHRERRPVGRSRTLRPRRAATPGATAAPTRSPSPPESTAWPEPMAARRDRPAEPIGERAGS